MKVGEKNQIYYYPSPPSEHKICLVGLDNAGKTTILYQFLMNEVVHTSPTIGSNVEEVRRSFEVVQVFNRLLAVEGCLFWLP